MREFGLLLSIVSITIGVMLLIAPGVLVKLSEQSNKLYNIDGLVYRNRNVFGALLMLSAAFLIYSTL